MCGITGIFNLEGERPSPETLKQMMDSIKHRGPDGEGSYIEGPVGLGHRRLSIIDLSNAGKQPMFSNDGNLVLIYNGEIYNFKEIRKELELVGYIFNSQTDSEVVLNSWHYWGKKCVLRFNGMFSFVIWDKRNSTMYMIRDRYGIKPLYYAQWGSTFLFGSEQKAILQHPVCKKELDKEALIEYFTFQNIFTNKTLLKNIFLLEPATIASISVNNKKVSFENYWDYKFEDLNKEEPEELKQELDRLLQKAVKRQMVSDVELGSYLSGGMDSGTLTALASKHLPYINTFTCGFDLSSASGLELSFDERKKAEAMSYLFKTEHYEMVLKSGDMERCLKDLAYAIEEPRVGQSYPNFYAAKLASKFVKVVLSGAGGDELFGGYPWRYFRATNCKNFDDYIEQYYGYWQRLLGQEEIKKVFSPIWSEVKHVDTREIFKNVYKSRDKEVDTVEKCINNSLYFEAKTFLHGLFVIEDKLSMAHSLETRVPFMDNDLVDFSLSCPVSMKIKNISEIEEINENTYGNKQSKVFQKSNNGKQILREVMKRYIPEDITNAEKQGFSSPDSSWFRGDSIEFVKKDLRNKDASLYDVMDYKETNTLLNEHLSGKKNRRLLIWSLLNLNQYLDLYL